MLFLEYVNKEKSLKDVERSSQELMMINAIGQTQEIRGARYPETLLMFLTIKWKTPNENSFLMVAPLRTYLEVNREKVKALLAEEEREILSDLLVAYSSVSSLAEDMTDKENIVPEENPLAKIYTDMSRTIGENSSTKTVTTEETSTMILKDILDELKNINQTLERVLDNQKMIKNVMEVPLRSDDETKKEESSKRPRLSLSVRPKARE